MKISSKYKPFFDIPKSDEKIESILSKRNLTNKDKEDLIYYRSLLKVDTVIFTGGRFSAKSFTVGLAIADWTVNYNHRVLFTRYTLISAKDSIIPEVEEKYSLLNYSDYIVKTNDRILCKHNKGKVIFKGHRTSSGNQTATLKSLKDLSCFVLEEAEEHESFDDWEKVKLSIRAVDVQNISVLILNPTTKEHWIYQKLFKENGVHGGFNGVKDNILYIHTDYRSTPREFIPDNHFEKFESARKKYEFYKSLNHKQREEVDNKTKQEYYWYKHIVLGGWRDSAEGAILKNWEFGKFDDNIPCGYGLDFGSKDPDAFVKCAIDSKNKKIYLKEEIYKNGLSTDELYSLILSAKPENKLIVADSAGARTINDFKIKGLNIVAVSKSKIVDDVKMLQDYTLIVEENSFNLEKELNNWIWLDKKGEIPIDAHNHLLDAMRYYCKTVLKPQRKRKGMKVL